MTPGNDELVRAVVPLPTGEPFTYYIPAAETMGPNAVPYIVRDGEAPVMAAARTGLQPVSILDKEVRLSRIAVRVSITPNRDKIHRIIGGWFDTFPSLKGVALPLTEALTHPRALVRANAAKQVAEQVRKASVNGKRAAKVKISETVIYGRLVIVKARVAPYAGDCKCKQAETNCHFFITCFPVDGYALLEAVFLDCPAQRDHKDNILDVVEMALEGGGIHVVEVAVVAPKRSVWWPGVPVDIDVVKLREEH